MRRLTTGFVLLSIVHVALSVFATSALAAEATNPEEGPPPHILFVLIDDLGWGDVGFHQLDSTSSSDRRLLRQRRAEVQTPVMDRLAQQEGLILNRHYVHHSCTGTRTSLQSGRLPVHVQTSLKNPEDPSSGMPRNLTGLAEHLKHAHPEYATHYVGKWDVGMATPKHTPKGRGYDTSLNYFEHKNDYWTQECVQSECCKKILLEDPDDNNDDDEPATKPKTNPAPTTIYDLWETDRPAKKSLLGSDYEEFIFQRRMLEIIDDHHTKQEQQPLFLFYAPHVAHCPLQVPQSYLDQFDFMDNDEGLCVAETFNIVGPHKKQPPYSCRKQYHAMVKLLDDILESLVDRLKQHGMWDNTLMVVTSDNGGPIDPEESGATNYPLRGGKYSDWEGGVRATAFVSGGYLPEHRRGKVVTQPIHICDWYATLPALAGINVQEEESKFTDDERVPPVDAVNVWPLIIGDAHDNYNEASKTSAPPPPRTEIPLSETALIVNEYKLLWDEKKPIYRSGWTYPDYPNSNTKTREIDDQAVNCSTGCLFNIETDPGEHHDIASEQPVRLQAMKERLKVLREGFFENDDRGVDSCPHGYDDDNSLPCACWMAVNYYGGFLGPYQEVDILADTSIFEKRIE